MGYQGTWAGLGAGVLVGLLSVACGQSAPNDAANTVNPDEVATGAASEAETANSMALNAVPAPAAEDGLSNPPSPPPGAFLAQLSPDQTAQLTSLGIDVVVPGTVPPSFRVADLRITQGDMVSYLIVYQNAENQCFAVEYADGGTLDPLATENRLPINPPLFTQDNGAQTYGLNYGKYAEPEWQAKFPETNLYTDWLAGPSGYYRLTGATEIKAMFATFDACQDVEPETAVALVESFTLITTEPMGSGTF